MSPAASDSSPMSQISSSVTAGVPTATYTFPKEQFSLFTPNSDVSLCKLDLTASKPTATEPTAKYISEISQLENATASAVQCEPAPVLTNETASKPPVEEVLTVEITNLDCSDIPRVEPGSPVLSPSADPFVPVLYPPGKDKFGRPILTSDQAEILLDYYEVVQDNLDSPVPPAVPDIPNVKILRNQLVKLPDGKDFTARILPPVTIEANKSAQFPPSYFLDLHERVRLGGT